MPINQLLKLQQATLIINKIKNKNIPVPGIEPEPAG